MRAVGFTASMVRFALDTRTEQLTRSPARWAVSMNMPRR